MPDYVTSLSRIRRVLDAAGAQEAADGERIVRIRHDRPPGSQRLEPCTPSSPHIITTTNPQLFSSQIGVHIPCTPVSLRTNGSVKADTHLNRRIPRGTPNRLDSGLISGSVRKFASNEARDDQW